MTDQAKTLRELIRRRAEQPARWAHTSPAMVVVTGGKGGVGTTTVAVHLAAALARQADRVLLVDADPDRADLAAICGLSTDHEPPDLRASGRRLDEVMVGGPEGVFVIPGAGRIAASGISTGQYHERWIRAAHAAREPFDWVIVDTGNGSSPSVRALWGAAQLVLLVATAELPAILDAYASVKTLADRAAPPAVHTLINRAGGPAVAYDVHGRLARAAWRFLGIHLESAGHIAAVEGESIGCPGEPSSAAESPLARDFGQLARTIRAAVNALPTAETLAPVEMETR